MRSPELPTSKKNYAQRWDENANKELWRRVDNIGYHILWRSLPQAMLSRGYDPTIHSLLFHSEAQYNHAPTYFLDMNSKYRRQPRELIWVELYDEKKPDRTQVCWKFGEKLSRFVYIDWKTEEVIDRVDVYPSGEDRFRNGSDIPCSALISGY